MASLEALIIAFQALWANRLRSILTIVGVFFGVLSVITIISATEGLMASVEDSLQALGPTTFILTKFGIITSHEGYLDALKRKNLTLEDMRAIEEGCRDCEDVAARAYRFRTVKRDGSSLNNVPMVGATANFIDIIDIEIGEGRFFTEFESERKRQVAFIGPTVAEELFPGVDPIGKILKIGGQKFKVTGIAKKRGSTLGNNQDNFVMLPLSTQTKLFGQPRNNLDLLVKARSVEGIEDTQDQVRAILRARRGVSYYDDDDFSILTADNIMSFVESTTSMFRMIIIGISSIALVIGGIVIMNIMMVSVTERTREIGIRKSIGANRRNILTQFLYETLILTIGGGGLGTATGIAIAIYLGSMIDLAISPTLFSVMMGLVISSGVGLFFGIYPAAKASKLDPIEALRYE